VLQNATPPERARLSIQAYSSRFLEVAGGMKLAISEGVAPPRRRTARKGSGEFITVTAGKCVLVVFDDFCLREESRRHAIELAKRLDCSLLALALPGGKNHDSAKARACLDPLRRDAEAAGVELSVALCEGDPASVLLKLLATHPPFRALVWGGDAAVVAAHPYGGGRHWFGRVRGQIRCPVVTAAPNARHRDDRGV